MGLLTGSYFTTMAKRMRLQMQHQLMSAQSQLMRLQKQISQQERSLNYQQRNMEMSMRNEMQRSIFGAQNGMSFNMNNGLGMMQGVDFNDKKVQQEMNAYNIAQQKAQMQYANAQTVWANYFEGVREMTLQPLKEQEIELTPSK